MEVAIIDYNAGNNRSVQFALERLGVVPVLTGDAARILSADKVIFPGVGAAGTAMQHLRAKGIDKVIVELQQPVLGICLGMQLLCSHSEEQDTECLGIFDEPVKRFSGSGKIPHTGWNDTCSLNSPLFSGIAGGTFLYYVHSYYVPVNDNTIARSEYMQPFSSAMHKDNFYAVQFHPEKSGAAGRRIIQNLLAL